MTAGREGTSVLRHFKKATIKEVAAQAAVSTTTVSLYVSGRKQVCSAETAERIDRAVSALSYTPSSLTRGLRQRHSTTIGVCLTNPMDPGVAYGQPFFEQLWRGIMFQADIENYSLLHYPAQVRDGKGCDPFLDGRVDGMLMHEHVDRRSSELAAAGMPLVLLTRSRNIPQGCGCAYADESLTTDVAMSHLWDLGHRRIAYVAGPVGEMLPRGVTFPVFGFDVDDVAVERLDGYVAWTKARRSYDPALIVTSGDWVAPNGPELLNDLLQVPDPPTAVFCANDALALEIIAAGRARGLEVPRDLSVIGVDNSPQSRENGVCLTTVDVHVEEVGKASLTALLRLMRDEAEERYRVSLPISRLVVRGTTAVLPENRNTLLEP